MKFRVEVMQGEICNRGITFIIGSTYRSKSRRRLNVTNEREYSDDKKEGLRRELLEGW